MKNYSFLIIRLSNVFPAAHGSAGETTAKRANEVQSGPWVEPFSLAKSALAFSVRPVHFPRIVALLLDLKALPGEDMDLIPSSFLTQ
jgi:hypothetical protein